MILSTYGNRAKRALPLQNAEAPLILSESGARTECSRAQRLFQAPRARGSKCRRYLADEEQATAIVQTVADPAATQEAVATVRVQHRHAPATAIEERRRPEGVDPVLAVELLVIVSELDSFRLDREAETRRVEALGESILNRVDSLAEKLGGDLRDKEIALAGGLVDLGAGRMTGPLAAVVKNRNTVLTRELRFECLYSKELGIAHVETVGRTDRLAGFAARHAATVRRTGLLARLLDDLNTLLKNRLHQLTADRASADHASELEVLIKRYFLRHPDIPLHPFGIPVTSMDHPCFETGYLRYFLTNTSTLPFLSFLSIYYDFIHCFPIDTAS